MHTTPTVLILIDHIFQPLDLEGHRHPVTGLCFGHRTKPTLLCSAADDYIIVWNIEKARASIDTGKILKNYDDQINITWCSLNHYLWVFTRSTKDALLKPLK